MFRLPCRLSDSTEIHTCEDAEGFLTIKNAFTAEMEAQSEQVYQFRLQLKTLKQAFTDALESQKTEDLNAYISNLEQLFQILFPVLKGLKSVNEIEDVNIRLVFKDLIPEDTPHYVLSEMFYYANRDLIMFPLTMDAERINSLSSKNTMEGVEFLSNKE